MIAAVPRANNVDFSIIAKDAKHHRAVPMAAVQDERARSAVTYIATIAVEFAQRAAKLSVTTAVESSVAKVAPSFYVLTAFRCVKDVKHFLAGPMAAIQHGSAKTVAPNFATAVAKSVLYAKPHIVKKMAVVDIALIAGTKLAPIAATVAANAEICFATIVRLPLNADAA